MSDLWMYDPTTNVWTWMSGANNDEEFQQTLPIHGEQGVPSLSSRPGSRTFNGGQWVDANGDLWLFGGKGAYSVGTMNDLWRYQTATGVWTWMHGVQTGEHPGVYGQIGIPDPGNMPSARSRVTCSWVGNNGQFWMFGGGDWAKDDLWRYDPETNQWTWIAGSLSPGATPVRGVQGVADAANTPGARHQAAGWVDGSGDLWLWGGEQNDSHGYNDVWKFDISANAWVFVAGDIEPEPAGNYPGLCLQGSGAMPTERFGSTAIWLDENGRPWLFGTCGEINFSEGKNDLWVYDPNSNDFTWAGGNSTPNAAGHWGVQGVTTEMNVPNARTLSASWRGNDGSFYLFGGSGTGSEGYTAFGDLWRLDPVLDCAGLPNGIQEDERSAVRLYPIPADDQLVIELVGDGYWGEYSVCDLTGQVVQRGRMAGARGVLGVSGLAPGSYFLQLQTSERRITRPFIISR